MRWGQTYTQEEIDDLIKNAKQEDSTATGSPSDVLVKFTFGSLTVNADITGTSTEAGAKGETNPCEIVAADSGKYVGANTIVFKNLKYGKDEICIHNLTFDAREGEEICELITPAVYQANGNQSTTDYDEYNLFHLHQQSGKEYTEEDINQILANPSYLLIGVRFGDTDAHWGQIKYGTTSSGRGIILQVGANEGQTMSFSIDDMSTRALGVNDSKVNMNTQQSASDSIRYIDKAIQKVSKQCPLLGAVQNRLGHTIANLDNAAENLQDAESDIRDAGTGESG